jgi:hypothetical protein
VILDAARPQIRHPWYVSPMGQAANEPEPVGFCPRSAERSARIIQDHARVPLVVAGSSYFRLSNFDSRSAEPGASTLAYAYPIPLAVI